MQLHMSTWKEVEEYLDRSQSMIIPIGSTEQHGPNGLIGTDAITANAIAIEVGRLTEQMVGPCINIGMAQHHLDFPGSISLRPQTLLKVIQDYINSLARNGFRSFFFINGHGGNIAIINSAFSEIYAQSSYQAATNTQTLMFRLQNWWTGKRVGDISRQLFPGSEGQHATPSEVALTFYLHPDFIKHVTMDPKIAPFGEIRDATDYRRQFPDGRIGSNPALATAANGQRVFEAAVADTRDDLLVFLG